MNTLISEGSSVKVGHELLAEVRAQAVRIGLVGDGEEPSGRLGHEQIDIRNLVREVRHGVRTLVEPVTG